MVQAGVDIRKEPGTRIIIHGEEGTLSTKTIPTALFNVVEQEQRSELLASYILSLIPEGTKLDCLGIGASGPVDTEFRNY